MAIGLTDRGYTAGGILIDRRFFGGPHERRNPRPVPGRVDEFPNADAARRLAALVGLDDPSTSLLRTLWPSSIRRRLNEWSIRVHGQAVPAVQTAHRAHTAFVFAGDVGVGKTELAEVLGQAIATRAKVEVTLYPLSLT